MWPFKIYDDSKIYEEWYLVIHNLWSIPSKKTEKQSKSYESAWLLATQGADAPLVVRSVLCTCVLNCCIDVYRECRSQTVSLARILPCFYCSLSHLVLPTPPRALAHVPSRWFSSAITHLRPHLVFVSLPIQKCPMCMCPVSFPIPRIRITHHPPPPPLLLLLLIPNSTSEYYVSVQVSPIFSTNMEIKTADFQDKKLWCLMGSLLVESQAYY